MNKVLLFGGIQIWAPGSIVRLKDKMINQGYLEPYRNELFTVIGDPSGIPYVSSPGFKKIAYCYLFDPVWSDNDLFEDIT